MKNEKICIKCKKSLDNSQYNRKGYYSNGDIKYRNDCKDCSKSNYKSYYYKNRKKVIAKNLQYKNTDKGRANQRRYRKNRYENDTNNLTDYYVKHIISNKSNLSHSDITNEMIETKRLIIKIKRELKK